MKTGSFNGTHSIFQDSKNRGVYYLWFWCPGCEAAHCVRFGADPGDGRPCWNFSGSEEKPTFSPSILVNKNDRDGMPVCHSYLEEGKLEFLSDCTHSLAGKIVSLPPAPDWILRWK